MKTPEQWADSKTDVILLTYDGKEVKAKREALIKLLREVQLDCFRQVIEDERIRQESQQKFMTFIAPNPRTGPAFDY